MAYNESDDETSILSEISELEREIADLDERLYLLFSRKRLINHRIADLRYILKCKHAKEQKGQ